MAEYMETNWSTIHTFNLSVYCMMLMSLLFLLVGIALKCCAITGLILIILTAVAHIAAVAVMGLFIYSDDGKKCTENDYKLTYSFYDEDSGIVHTDMSFSEHGQVLKG